mgnify:CR=1 FL=1
MRVRLALPDDLPAIASIYDREVLTSTATMDTVARTDAEHQAWLEAHPADAYPAFVAERAGTVLGWSSLTAFSPRRGYDRCAEVSVYVHHEHRGEGVGLRLMRELIAASQALGFRHLVSRIEASGEASLALHARYGFTRAGTLHQVAEKFGRPLDVALLELLLPPT